ncbi:MAG: hypothetical protein JW946_01170, partial [Candidatus Omnitrophica bacterium]|nr:hypothetical protein [Candidatus Omnitrophota bacterium]
MDIDQLKAMAKREFNNAMCLIGIIPFLVFVYLLVNRASSFEVFVGSTGRILFASVIVLLLGIVLG